MSWPTTGPTKFRANRSANFWRVVLQAYYENMRLRPSSMPLGIDMQLYRRTNCGALATFHMLDTRQYRADQPCGDKPRANCAERVDSARSMLGTQQESLLFNGFQRSQARWDLLGQPVFFSQVDSMPGPNRRFNLDAWNGYAANRDRIVSAMNVFAILYELLAFRVAASIAYFGLLGTWFIVAVHTATSSVRGNLFQTLVQLWPRRTKSLPPGRGQDELSEPNR